MGSETFEGMNGWMDGWMDVSIIYRRSTSIGHIASNRLYTILRNELAGKKTKENQD